MLLSGTSQKGVECFNLVHLTKATKSGEEKEEEIYEGANWTLLFTYPRPLPISETPTFLFPGTS